MKPDELADRMKTELKRTDSELPETQLNQCFEALSEAGQQGFDALLDIGLAGVDTQKDSSFYLKLIDTIFSMLSSDETRTNARLVLDITKEGNFMPRNILGTSKTLEMTEEQAEANFGKWLSPRILNN